MNVKQLNTILIAACLVASAPIPGSRAAAQSDARVAATDHTGAQALGLVLRRMASPRRVLMIGAHPDDENTAVLATLALGVGADVAYLSLTRGDGGQNLVGPELTEGLGLIRTDELLAARRIDGARQYFSRAYDYGYSKSADEAFRHWPRDSLIADAVAVIRRFRPDVILSVWSGTPRDGHGQHQAAGQVAIEAFEAAADPARFTGQIRAGLRPHRATHLLQSTWRPSTEPAFWLQTGEFDRLFGRSHFQISMASRSLHRSQDQGSEQPPGPQQTAVVPLGERALARPPASLFDGVPATLSDFAAVGSDPSLKAALSSFRTSVDQATMSFNPLRPDALIPHLAAALDALDRAAPLAADPELRFRIEVERSETGEAMRLATGLVLDAIADDPMVVPGEDFSITLRLWNGGTRRITVDRLAPELPDGWSAEPLDVVAADLEPGVMAERRFRVTVARDARPSEPYYLETPRAGDLYDWPDDLTLRGLPYGPDPVGALARVRVGEQTLAIRVDASFIDVDKALGEKRLPILVVPALGVAVEPAVAVLPLGAGANGNGATGTVTRPSAQVSVTLTAEAADGLDGVLRLEPPPGWNVEPANVSVRFDGPGQRRAVSFTVQPPAGLQPGMYRVGAVFEAADGRKYSRGWSRIDYPHTQPRLLFRDGAATFSAFPVVLDAILRVGIIEGAGDDAGAALARMGANVESIGPDALRNGDLGRYDAIVAGIRAYEVRPDLIDANDRILEWVEKGGTLVVQYNKHEFVRGGFAPYPLAIAQSADRVTDEESPVRFLVPEHPALNVPNRIGPADFEGWVQERGLYFPNGWDDRYTALIELNDPDEPAQQGSLLVTNHGAGTYVYMTLSFFRQLPEGVPGAYRLLANLVSLGGS